MIEELKARIAELERQLENERIRLAACGSAALGYFEGCKDEYKSASLDDVLRLRKRVDLLERQQALLVEALRLGTSVLHEYPGGEICLCSQCEFVRARAKALADVKSSKYVPPKPNHQVQSLIEAARCLGVAQAKGDPTQHWESAVADLSVALNAAVKPAGQKGGE